MSLANSATSPLIVFGVFPDWFCMASRVRQHWAISCGSAGPCVFLLAQMLQEFVVNLSRYDFVEMISVYSCGKADQTIGNVGMPLAGQAVAKFSKKSATFYCPTAGIKIFAVLPRFPCVSLVGLPMFPLLVV